MAHKGYDFAGYAARYNVRCTDNTVIKPGCFHDMDGKTIPLVYQHNHDDISQVLGHCELEERPKGLYAYAYCNNNEGGKMAKEAVANGDVNAFSIWANELKRNGGDIYHGDAKEVSLVLAGADKTALIDTVVAHGDISDDEAEIAFLGGYGELTLAHSDTKKKKDEDEEDDEEENASKKEQNMAANKQRDEVNQDTSEDDEESTDNNSGKTVQDVLNTFNKEQRTVLNYIVGKAIEDTKNGGSDEEADDEESDDEDDNSDEEDKKVKHNVFDTNDVETRDYISHADQGDILREAKRTGMTFQSALGEYLDDAGIQHDDTADAVAGFDDNTQVYDNRTSLNLMFPDYREANGTMPELITSDQGWITRVLAKVKKAPFSRVRTSQVDIRNIDELRAKGYMKGKKKALSGSYSLIRRTTDPQTVYVRSSLNRDDIVDITDFDYVQYQYNIDKLMLNEEVATAIMLGDNRDDDAADKIFPSHIRPIWTDDELYVKHITVDIDKARKELQGSDTSVHFSDNYVYAEAIIEALLHGRETNYRGTGTPDFYCTPALMNTMLLSRDFNGRRIYSSKAELQSALNIGEMITAEQFTDRVRTDAQGKKHKLLGIVGNLADYQVGSTKGGQISHFTQFDIDFNQEKSLIETRLSGAVTRIYSFIVLEEDVNDTASGAKANSFTTD